MWEFGRFLYCFLWIELVEYYYVMEFIVVIMFLIRLCREVYFVVLEYDGGWC